MDSFESDLINREVFAGATFVRFDVYFAVACPSGFGDAYIGL